MEPPRECLKRVLRRGISRGLLPKDLDVEASMALLLGPMLYAHIFQKERLKQLPNLGTKTAEAFCRAFAMDRRAG